MDAIAPTSNRNAADASADATSPRDDAALLMPVLVVDAALDGAPVDESIGPAPHASVLHVCCDSPVQGAPLPEGAGLLQVRVCAPPPHDVEHAVQLDQTPSTVRVQLMFVRDAG